MSISNPNPNTSNAALDTALKVLRFLKEISDPLPPLKSAVSGAAAVVENIQLYKSGSNDWVLFGKLIADQLNLVTEKITTCQHQFVLDHALEKDITALSDSISAIEGAVKETLKRRKVKRFFGAREDADQLRSLKEQFNTAIMLFLLGTDLNQRTQPRRSVTMPQTQTLAQVTTDIPDMPYYIHGRESYIQELVSRLIDCHRTGEPARISINGEAGLGKTTAALVMLHNREVRSLFGVHRYFVSCEASTTPVLLRSTLATSLRITIGDGQQDIMFKIKEVLKRDNLPVLLVLDNFETCWNSINRYEIQTILMSLASIKNVTLILTMRGHNNPDGVAWTPFPLLQVLDPTDARVVFEDITSESFDESVGCCIDRLLGEVGYLPLAIVLFARLVRNGESVTFLSERWKKERTALISHGSSERHYNLDASIRMSITSRPMIDFPPALRLLSILSYLPDGIPRKHLGSITSISQTDILNAASTLREVGLARYEGETLKSIPPIRLHVAQYNPPLVGDVLRCRRYYATLILEAVEYKTMVDISQFTTRLAPELGNVHAILDHWIESGEELNGVVSLVLDLSNFLYPTPYQTDLVEKVLHSKDLYIPDDMKAALFHTQGMSSVVTYDYPTARQYLKTARSLYEKLDDKVGALKCMWALGDQFRSAGHYKQACEHLSVALIECQRLGPEHLTTEAACLWSLSETLNTMGELKEGNRLAQMAQEAFRKLNNKAGVMGAKLLCINIEFYKDNFELAQSMLEAALKECEDLQDMNNYRLCLLQLGRLHSFAQNFEEAEKYLFRVLEFCKQYSSKYSSKEALIATYGYLGDVTIVQGQRENARHYFNLALEVCSDVLNNQMHSAEMLGRFGKLRFSEGDNQTARLLISRARDLFEEMGCRRGTALTEGFLADLDASEENHDGAIVRYRTAANLFSYMDNGPRAAIYLSKAENLEQPQQQSKPQPASLLF